MENKNGLPLSMDRNTPAWLTVCHSALPSVLVLMQQVISLGSQEIQKHGTKRRS